MPSTVEIMIPATTLPLRVPRPRLVSRRRAALALGVLTSVLIPVLAFRGASLAETGRLIAGSNVWALALGGCCFLATILVRSRRWYHLVSARQPVRMRSCLSATCVGLLANNVLPFRLGDVVRAATLQQIDRVSGAKVLATIFVERILDILTLVLFLGAYLTFADAGAHDAELKAAGLLALAGGIGIACVLAAGYRGRRRLARLLAAPVAWSNPALGTKVNELAGRFLDGLNVFVSPLQALKVLGLSLCLWGAAMGSYYFAGRSQGLDVPFAAYTVVLFATAFGAILPAAPGAVGTFHGFARIGLYLVGVTSTEQALAFAAVLYAVEWCLVTVVGLYFLKRDGLRLTARGGVTDAAPTAA